MSTVLTWQEAAAAGASVCGGKGWNLGRLHRYGFPVPAGGVLPEEAYRQFMMPLEQQREALAGVAAHEAITPVVSAALHQLRQAIMEAPLPDAVTAAVGSFLRSSGLEKRSVAVRSSATAEDSSTASFAGIHQSVLGVQGTTAVLDAIRICYASLWTPQAVAYRRHRGLRDDEVACAVVICAMVTQPVAAGVAFSCDPRTGHRDHLAISAAPGLGEAVVNGSVNPEEIRLGLKGNSITVLERSGRSDQVLTDPLACQLGRLTLRVHWALGAGQDPQDVEWAHDGRQFWLLQARPVTELPRVTYPEAAHLPVIWSNANLKDAVGEVQSTLGWGLIQRMAKRMLYANTAAAGYPWPHGSEIIRRFDGRAYFDLTTLLWAHYDALGMHPRELSAMLGGHQPEIPVPPGSPFRGRKGLARQVARLRMAIALMRSTRAFRLDIQRARRHVGQVMGVNVAAASGLELLEAVGAMGWAQEEMGPRFQLANVYSGMVYEPLFAILDRLAPGRGRALATALAAGGGGVTSAEHGYRLFEVAHAAQMDPGAREYLAAYRDPLGWRHLPAGSPFRMGMERFLADFGHRCVNEADVATPRWSDDPTYLLEQVKALLAAGTTVAPREGALAARKAAEGEVAGLTWFWRPVIRMLADRVRKGAALREEGKSTLIALIQPARHVVLEVGRRMVEAGLLSDAADVFHLSLIDVEQYLRGEWSGEGACELAADRKAQMAQWRTMQPPDVIIVDGQGRTTAPAATAPPLAGKALSGIGAAAGRATGRARIIRHPDEGHLLQPGEVLLAPSTDPAWTPLFLRASAIVMEVGGYLSHGAIVAREYGIPAVVNIPGLLSHVRDGQLLEVDGNAGRVTLV